VFNLDFLDSLGSNLTNALSWVIELLPDSPFSAVSTTDVSTYMGTLNWFIPIDKMVAELELWLTCVTVFYVYQMILRWVRAIE
jgi:hypothetical protein